MMLMCLAMVAGLLMFSIEAKAQCAAPHDGDEIGISGGAKVRYGEDDNTGTLTIDKRGDWEEDLLVYWVKSDSKYYLVCLFNGEYSLFSVVWGRDYSEFENCVISTFSEKATADSWMANDYCIYWVPPHTHSWTYGTIYEPSEEMDGLECEYCSCGARRNIKTTSALSTIIQNRYSQIDQATPGKDTILEMKNNCNFSQEFMKKLAAKNNCNFILRFTYEHKNYEVYIPAGTKFDTSLEWYGPKKIMEMFGWKQLY